MSFTDDMQDVPESKTFAIANRLYSGGIFVRQIQMNNILHDKLLHDD